MLDILIGILEELFGGGTKKQAQPRRRTTNPQEGGDGGAPDAPRQFNSFEDFVKHAVGVEEVPEKPPVEPGPAAASRRTRPPLPATTAGRGRRPDYFPSPPPVPKVETPAPTSQRETSMAQTMTQPFAPSDKTAAVPEFVARLRNNPAAAREAFVYAEIFGPPLADR